MPIDVSQLPYRPCVGLLVLNKSGMVWVGRRVGSPNQAGGGWWQMPQGGIDEGEDHTVAALRELREETGMRSARILRASATWHNYDLPRELLGRVWGGKYRGQTQKWFALQFDGADSEINIKPEDHDQEFDLWRWAPKSELISIVVPFKRDVYVKVLEEFGDLIV
ncbi:MAG: RNA pyrophosphohydrolase [Hyphomicrobiaceae bacterium]|nr:RNA pyrophosphohydrolase [Hyphomicrobiaceae bacterium]